MVFPSENEKKKMDFTIEFSIFELVNVSILIFFGPSFPENGISTLKQKK